MNTNDWQIIGIAAGIATAAATTISLVISMLWRVLDRQKADWMVWDGKSRWRASDKHGHQGQPPSAECELANVGDGAGYAVRIVGLGCHVQMQGDWIPGSPTSAGRREPLSLMPSAPPGAQIHLRVYCEPSLWEEAAIAIVWTASPTWLKRWSRRTRKTWLADIASKPILEAQKVMDRDGVLVSAEVIEAPSFPVLSDRLGPDYRALPPWWQLLARRRLASKVKRGR